ncbi:trk system potassium uptake protein TrkA [Clostridium pascui]|uniref:NAD-binding protein n=1 Tax=Clostridium pascui TaxID=46609 RepID=UPI00195C1C51|nr:NAD-binding protein [Clostridium pascui]MBM7869943.1 trk system potassium uptake protein TrkA [Clostridium pascui]
MHVIIVGCGRLGSTIARYLGENGHDVVIIDNDGERLNNVESSFNGIKIKGIEFDTDTLMEAGIDKADIFLALTPDDNKNIMACKIAKDIFQVKKVIGRVSNLNMESAYLDLSIDVINPIKLAVNSLNEKMFS